MVVMIMITACLLMLTVHLLIMLYLYQVLHGLVCVALYLVINWYVTCDQIVVYGGVTETRPRTNLDTGPASSLRHATRSAVARQRRHVCIRLLLTVFGAFGVFGCGFYSLPWFFTVDRCGECVFQGSLGWLGKTTSHGSPLFVAVVK